MSTEIILCAAIHFDDGINHVHQPFNIETGFVICGRRHHNCFATLSALKVDKAILKNHKQGFITNTNRFVDREEAAVIAFKAGQSTQTTTLFSEDLY
jgi:hypothetical protein